MEPSTSIRNMLAGNCMFVPKYQRAYSWDTETDKLKPPKQVNTFLTDLEHYRQSNTKSKYYFGHFLYELKSGNKFGVIDGQQRLTTIIIFLSALFQCLETMRSLSEDEEVLKEDMIVRRSTYRFETVDYDRWLLKDYVINRSRTDRHGLKTKSAERIVKAYDFVYSYLSSKNQDYLVEILDVIQKSSCSTHIVKDEAEAIQMFIFQNNRGKKPSNLEIIKAQFMFNIHLSGGNARDSLLEEIKTRFAHIYESISLIEEYVKEDTVLLHTLRVHFNSLRETNALDKIEDNLSKDNSIEFIQSFTQSLTTSFEKLEQFYIKDERKYIGIHSLITLGGINIALPFIIKAYKFGLTVEQVNILCKNFESIVLRHRLIGTRADITSRLQKVYQNFNAENSDIQQIIDRIEFLKSVTSDNWWWSYWNNEQLKNSVQGKINPSTAKYILWKYEQYLKSIGQKGYTPQRFESIKDPELEHIAPKTENPEMGYDVYDDEFKTQYLDCLGNYILLSKSHNCSIGNKPFKVKRDSYRKLDQQLEIQEMTVNNELWTRKLIEDRQNKIVDFIMKEL